MQPISFAEVLSRFHLRGTFPTTKPTSTRWEIVVLQNRTQAFRRKAPGYVFELDHAFAGTREGVGGTA